MVLISPTEAIEITRRISNVIYSSSKSDDFRLNIKDLRDGMRRVDAEGEVTDISAPREVSLRTGDQARVADATLTDESGSIKLSLWDDQIDAVKKGAKVRITNGYINTFRGERQLNVGRYGKLEIL